MKLGSGLPIQLWQTHLYKKSKPRHRNILKLFTVLNFSMLLNHYFQPQTSIQKQIWTFRITLNVNKQREREGERKMKSFLEGSLLVAGLKNCNLSILSEMWMMLYESFNNTYTSKWLIKQCPKAEQAFPRLNLWYFKGKYTDNLSSHNYFSFIYLQNL